MKLVYDHTAMDTLRGAVAKLPEVQPPSDALPRTKDHHAGSANALPARSEPQQQVGSGSGGGYGLGYKSGTQNGAKRS
ncbi:MAG TPA: hypothetical protein VJV78_00330 [Polyangiales bacterium]|nr:hypothetical protein [Polyangiales bacterium]